MSEFKSISEELPDVNRVVLDRDGRLMKWDGNHWHFLIEGSWHRIGFPSQRWIYLDFESIEQPDYATLVGYVNQLGQTQLAGLFAEVVKACLAKCCFQDGGMELVIQRLRGTSQ